MKTIKTKIYSFLLMLVFALVGFSGCKKDDRVGSVVFWQTKSNAQLLQSIGITSLKMYLGGKLVGSQAASIYFNASPDCGAQGAVTAKHQLGTLTSQVVAYQVLDQDNDVVYDGTMEIKDGVCLGFQLD
jgi:hypothetical protein